MNDFDREQLSIEQLLVRLRNLQTLHEDAVIRGDDHRAAQLQKDIKEVEKQIEKV